VIRRVILKEGTEGDVRMLLGLWKFSVSFFFTLIVLGSFFQLGLISTIIGAFGGMLLGWALQQPVSGFAAWLMITAKRPFRVGDRIRLPSHRLAGDVIDVGAMYTVLDQVGGAVGSEEAVGRNILIPNAMLFSNLVINYTPRNENNGQLEDEPALKKARESAYILDEVVARITFDSDWDMAEKILLNSAAEATQSIIKETAEEPYIRSDMYDYGVYMRLRYMTLATDRPRIKYLIERKIFKEFSGNEEVDFAIPYVYSSRKGKRESYVLDRPIQSPQQCASLFSLDPFVSSFVVAPSAERNLSSIVAKQNYGASFSLQSAHLTLFKTLAKDTSALATHQSSSHTLRISAARRLMKQTYFSHPQISPF